MFLIDNHEPELGNGSEHGGASADDNLRLAIPDARPLVKALAFGKGRMKNRHLIAEVSPQPAREHRRQHYLWYQHHRGTALLQANAHRPHIHFGLSAAGDAVKKKRGVITSPQRLFDLTQHTRLGLSKFKLLHLRKNRTCQRIAANRLQRHFDNTSFL